MERIKLNDNCKRIFREIRDGNYPKDVPDSDVPDFEILLHNNLVDAKEGKYTNYISIRISAYGRQYLEANPKLKDPSIWEDKKYWITTGVSVLALIISIIALVKKSC